MLASVATALAPYQLVLIAVGSGKPRPRFLATAVPRDPTSAAELESREERIDQRHDERSE